MSDHINMKTVKHQYGTTVWLCPSGFNPSQNETHGFWFTNAPWAIMVSKRGISFEEGSHISPTDFRMEQLIEALRIANELWLDEFLNSENKVLGESATDKKS